MHCCEIVIWLLTGSGLVLQCSTADVVPESVTTPGDCIDSPHWCKETNSLYYVDRTGGTIHRYDETTSTDYCAVIGDFTKLAFIIPVDGVANTFVIGNGKLVGIYEWDGLCAGPLTAKSTIDIGYPVYSGKTDKSGRLYVSTEGKDLFLVGSDKTVTPQKLPDGEWLEMAWNLNNTIMYRIQTDKIMQFTFDASSGTVSPDPTLWLDLHCFNITDDFCGINVDADDNLWATSMDNSYVAYISVETKRFKNVLMLDDVLLTSSTFGGPNLDVVYVTTCKDSHYSENSGSLIRTTGINITGVAAASVKINV